MIVICHQKEVGRYAPNDIDFCENYCADRNQKITISEQGWKNVTGTNNVTKFYALGK